MPCPGHVLIYFGFALWNFVFLFVRWIRTEHISVFTQ